MGNANVPSERDLKETLCELQDDELEFVRGRGEAVTFTFTITNSPSFRGGVGSNETITIGGSRTE